MPDENGVRKIEAPPEFHALNGVAERAILSSCTQTYAYLGRGDTLVRRNGEKAAAGYSRRRLAGAGAATRAV